MKTVFIIAKNSFREFLRDRVVFVFMFIAIFLFLMSLVLGALSFQEQQRILAHFGLTAIHLAGLGIVAFIGAFVLHRELERQTCLLVLARPVDRAHFIVGKFLGVVFLNTLIWAMLSAILYGMLKGEFNFWKYLTVILGIYFEHLILLSIAMFASVFLRPSIALFNTIGVFLAGHWIQEVEFFAKKTNDQFFLATANVIQKVVPNLFRMNWRSVYFLENGVPDGQLPWVVLHSFGWVVLMLSGSVLIFRRKDLV